MSQPDRDAGTPAGGTAPVETATHAEMVVGFNAELGFRLTEWRLDYARLELTVAPKHLNRSGIVHGGVLATVCPADKKILHGMRDAMMLPCVAR